MIKFGTDGWRGVIAEDYTFANLRLVSEALANYILKRGEADNGIVVGYDARFLSRQFAEDCAAILSQKGIKVWISESILPTPALTWQVVDRQSAGGVMITASHNPAQYNGFKFKATYGGSASPEIIAEIETEVHDLEETQAVIAKPSPSLQVISFMPKEAYLSHVRSLLDPNVLQGFKGKIVFDMMHGAAMGYAQTLATEYGLNLVEVRGDYNPSFKGVNPEPIDKNLSALRESVLEEDAFIGLATDGDGDRIGAMDRDGTFINAHQIMALLIKYLVEKKGWTGGVARTVTVSDLVRRTAEKYGLKCYETPVGFKYIANLMIHDDILIGGEESGGIGLKNYIPERDGIMLGFLLIEMVAAYGQTLGELLKELMDEVGYLFYAREDLHLSNEQKESLMSHLVNETPIQIGSNDIQSVNKADGCKCYLAGGDWVMFRPSGTEPIVRIYVEAENEEKVKAIMEAAVTYAKTF